MMEHCDVLIVGAGYAGAVSARILAEAGKKVVVLEKRGHIAGNSYDYLDENEVLRHEYGPHIFHTSSKKAVDFLSRFTDWYPYTHRVLGVIEYTLVPIPFNLTSIERLFDADRAEHLKKVLVDAYGMDRKVPILELRKNPDPEVQMLAEYIFEHVFKYYTMKQWGYGAEQIDPAVTARVPVLVGYDDRYFQDEFQKMPEHGFTAMFEKMLDHPNITVHCGVEAMDHLHLDPLTHTITLDGEVFHGELIYTGLVDELLSFSMGELSYRSLDFEVHSEEGTSQPVTTVNYPDPAEVHPYTRISEYKHMMKNPPSARTTIAVEYPYAFDRRADKGNVPYYPVFTEESKARYDAYRAVADEFENLHLLGRLAEYRYYNMDAITERAIEFCQELLNK